jgi:hypothetical protein
MDMMRVMHPEAALRSADGEPLPLDESMVRGELHRAIVPSRNSDGLPAWIGLVSQSRNLLGSVYLSMEMLWYSSRPVLIERWLYVHPDERRSNVAAALIEIAKRSADAARVDLLIGHMTAGREAAKTRFYRRHLGSPIGACFMYHGGAEDETASESRDPQPGGI